MKIDLNELNKRVEEKLLTRQKHPEFPLWIYNYTDICQYGKNWDEYTTIARGLILDEEGNIIARPFPKFFNLEELESLGLKLPNERYEVSVKYDGSLGISYFYNGQMYLATRGSFISTQSQIGQQILLEKYSKVAIDKSKTYLFEIIYPENRIVVNYGDTRDLILLAVVDTETGQEVYNHNCGFREKEKGPNDIATLKSLAKPNEEGFVITFTSGFRAKVKFDEYVRLHRIMTGVTPRRIWEVLRNGDNMDDYLRGVPEEFAIWINSIRDEIITEYLKVERRAKDAFYDIKAELYPMLKVTATQETTPTETTAVPTRKDFAIKIMENYKDISGILFKMLDKQEYADLIWKMIRPEALDPFKVEI